MDTGELQVYSILFWLGALFVALLCVLGIRGLVKLVKIANEGDGKP